MEKPFKQGYSIILLGVLCFALGSSDIEVVTAKEFNVTKDIKVRIWNNNIPIADNGLMFILAGTETLELNCSKPGHSKQDISWRQQQIWLDVSTVLLMDNETITLLLKIDQVRNGTVYWCGPRYDNPFINIKPSQVTIITGELPSPPTNIRQKIVGLRSFEIIISWRGTYTSRLPTHYEVTYEPCINSSYCRGRYPFCTRTHITGKTEYECNKPREEMKSLDFLRDLYRVTIATVNPLGERKAPEFEINADFGGPNTTLYATPRPPLNLKVYSTPDTIIVQWTERDSWYLVRTRYKILYHKDTDHVNKTKVVKGQTMVRLKEGIDPYTIYYIYVTVEFLDDDDNSGSGFSEPLGPRVIRTLEGTPERGPDIENASSSRYPYNMTKRNVTISWKFPPTSSFRGKPSHINVSFRKVTTDSQDFQTKLIPVTGNSPSQAVLGGLDSLDAYTFSLALCNNNTCGPNGNEKTIEPIKVLALNQPGIKDATDAFLYAIIGALVFLGIISSAVLFYCICIRKSKNKDSKVQLHVRVGSLEQDYQGPYEDVDQLSSSGEYDTAE